mgnify:CR=1 FL=1
MTNSLTMFKLETMIYASEDGTNSVFTLNSALQKQLDALATQHPEGVPAEGKGRSWRGNVSGQGCRTGYPARAGHRSAMVK